MDQNLSNLSSFKIPLIGIAGGSGSGKTTLAEYLFASLNAQVTLLPFDSYYRDLSHLTEAERVSTNFDHPNALEIPLLREHLLALKHGQSVLSPVYDFLTHTRVGNKRLQPGEIILIEGTLILSIPEIQELIDLAFFVDIPDDIRLMRRIQRDLEERGRDFPFIAHQYLTMVRPMYQEFILPSKQHADYILNGEEPVEPLARIVQEALQRWNAQRNGKLSP